MLLQKSHPRKYQTNQPSALTSIEERTRKKELAARESQLARLEQEITIREQAIKKLESLMVAPNFYNDREAAQPLVNRHQTLMWEVGDLMKEWEELQNREKSPPDSV